MIVYNNLTGNDTLQSKVKTENRIFVYFKDNICGII